MIRVLCATNECTHLAAQLAAVTAERDELVRQVAAMARHLEAERQGKEFYEGLFREATTAPTTHAGAKNRG